MSNRKLYARHEQSADATPGRFDVMLYFDPDCDEPAEQIPWARRRTRPDRRYRWHILGDRHYRLIWLPTLEQTTRDDFTLRNDPPAPPKARFENAASRQAVLFAGLDCLGGQLDLFATDGEQPPAPTGETVKTQVPTENPGFGHDE